MTYFVYELSFPSGKKYVGQTLDYDNRINSHQSSSKYAGGLPLRQELEKTSCEFEESIIAKCDSLQEALFIENKKINEYKDLGISLNVISNCINPVSEKKGVSVKKLLNDSVFVKAEFARRIDWSKAQLNQWLKGVGNIPEDKFEALKRELKKYGYS